MIRTTTLPSLIFCCLLLFGAAVAAADAGVPDAKAAGAAPAEKAEAKKADSDGAKPPETVNEAMGMGKQIVQAAKQGHWALVLGLIVMILTALVNRVFRAKIPPAILPWLAIGLGIIGQGALTLHYSGDWATAIFAGMTAGLTAGGSYSAFGKYLPGIGTKKLKPETA